MVYNNPLLQYQCGPLIQLILVYWLSAKSTDRIFNGFMDEVRFLNRRAPADEIAETYRMGGQS